MGKKIIKTNYRNLRDFDPLSFYKQKNNYNRIYFLLKYAILAPSTHNTQPWLFKIESENCKIFIDSNRLLPESDPENRDLYISLGCSVQNLVEAAKIYGIFKSVSFYPKSKNLVADIYFKNVLTNKKKLDKKSLVIIKAIKNRKNSRGFFINKNIDKIILNKLRHLSLSDVIQVDFINKAEKIKIIAELTSESILKMYGIKQFRNELSSWINNNLSKRREGIPGYSLKFSTLVSFFFPFITRNFNIGKLVAKLNYSSINSAPLICLLSTKNNTPEDWFKIGLLSEKIFIKCTQVGLSTSISVAALEVRSVRDLLKKKLGLVTNPQFIINIGYMKPNNFYTPRLLVKNKLIK